MVALIVLSIRLQTSRPCNRQAYITNAHARPIHATIALMCMHTEKRHGMHPPHPSPVSSRRRGDVDAIRFKRLRVEQPSEELVHRHDEAAIVLDDLATVLVAPQPLEALKRQRRRELVREQLLDPWTQPAQAREGESGAHARHKQGARVRDTSEAYKYTRRVSLHRLHVGGRPRGRRIDARARTAPRPLASACPAQ